MSLSDVGTVWVGAGRDGGIPDSEWGVPVHADRTLFEFLTLESAQAGLSWLTILRKREGYQRAFDGFDIVKVAAYDNVKTTSLLEDPSSYATA